MSLTNKDEEEFDYLFKIVLIGDAGIGKTSIVQRFKAGNFTGLHANTIGVDFTMKTLTIDGHTVKLHIWDTGGQERFRAITQSYYRSANGIVLVYDVTQASTFAEVRRWHEDIKKYANTDIKCILIGNKCDLVQKLEVTEEAANELSSSLGITNTLQTSAIDGHNIHNAFLQLTKDLIATQQNSGLLNESNPNQILTIDATTIGKKCAC